jgi:hypothetical protein
MRAGKGTGTLEQPPRERQGREPRREGEGKTRGLGEHPDRRAKRSYIAYMFHEIFIWVMVLILLLVRINNRCITVHHDYHFGARDARPKRTLVSPSASGAQPVPLAGLWKALEGLGADASRRRRRKLYSSFAPLLPPPISSRLYGRARTCTRTRTRCRQTCGKNEMKTPARNRT